MTSDALTQCKDTVGVGTTGKNNIPGREGCCPPFTVSAKCPDERTDTKEVHKKKR